MKRIYQCPSSSALSFDEESMLAMSEIAVDVETDDRVDAEEIMSRIYEPSFSEGID